jgi:ankyrin repeat protein
MLGLSQKEKDAVLGAALRSENLAAVKKALQRGGNPNGFMDAERKQPFIVWAADRYFSTEAERAVTVLLEAKADVNQPDADGNTALHRAIYHRNSTVIAKLLEAGADMMAKNKSGQTPFQMCLSNHAGAHVLHRLIEQGALKAYKETADMPHAMLDLLTRAIESTSDGQYIATQVLPEVENINALVDKGRAPLHSAVGHKQEYMVKSLLARPEADVNLRDRRGRTPLYIALASGHHELAKLLIEHGADVSATDEKNTPAIALAAKGGSIALVRQIARQQKEKNLPVDYDAALLAAAQKGHARLIDVLIAEGAHKNAVNENGETALILAAQGGHMEAIKMLTVKHEVDTQIADNSGQIAYDHAKQGRHKEAIDYLICFQPGYEPPPPPPPPVDTSRFAKVSAYSIDVKEKGLTMTFNFWTQQVIYREPERNQIAVVRNFDEIQRREAIAEAYDVLKRLGGNPPEYGVTDVQKKPLGAAVQKPKNG